MALALAEARRGRRGGRGPGRRRRPDRRGGRRRPHNEREGPATRRRTPRSWPCATPPPPSAAGGSPTLTLVVTLEPCPMCAGALVAARVGRVVFGASDPRAGACGTLYNLCTDPRLNHEVEVTGGVAAAECADLLSSFFAGEADRLGDPRTRHRHAAAGHVDPIGGSGTVSLPDLVLRADDAPRSPLHEVPDQVRATSISPGGVRERPNRTVSKTVVPHGYRGFKSHLLRSGPERPTA